MPIVPIVDLDLGFKGSVFCPAPSLCVVPTGCLLSACRSHVNHSTLSILSPGLAFLSKFNKESNSSLVSPPCVPSLLSLPCVPSLVSPPCVPSLVSPLLCLLLRLSIFPRAPTIGESSSLCFDLSAQSRSFIFFRPNLHFPLSSPCSGLDPR